MGTEVTVLALTWEYQFSPRDTHFYSKYEYLAIGNHNIYINMGTEVTVLALTWEYPVSQRDTLNMFHRGIP